MKQDRVGTPAEECCCIQPLRAEQNQAFLMEVFMLGSTVWSSASVTAGTVPQVVTFEDSQAIHACLPQPDSCMLRQCWMAELSPAFGTLSQRGGVET